jgi:CelD/BcsL family acetyltransferase involved in cellulose biosynthesis
MHFYPVVALPLLTETLDRMTRLPEPNHDPAVKSASRLSVAVCSTTEGLQALQADWEALEDRSDCSVFQTYCWMSEWWSAYGQNRALYCVQFRDKEKLVGLAPFFFQDVRLFGISLVRRLMPVAHHESDYFDLLIERGREEEVTRAFAEHLLRTVGTWHVTDLDEVTADSQTLRRLPAIIQELGGEAILFEGTVCPRVPLPATYDAFLQELGPNTRYNVKRKWNKLRAMPGYREIMITSGDEEIRKGLDLFLEVHRARWKSVGFPSLFESRQALQFLSRVTTSASRKGWLRLSLMLVDGKPVASSIDFNRNGVIAMYQSNVSAPPDVMKQSPGFLVKMFAIERGIAEGMRVYDMLRGDETYKTDHFKGTNVSNWSIRITPGRHGAGLRVRLFLLYALAARVRGRLALEVHEFKRYALTQRLTPLSVMRYAGSRFTYMWNIGSRFLRVFFLRKEQ